MPHKQKISIAEKIRIVREYLGGKIGISEAARQAGAAAETVKLWINKYENEGVEGFTHEGQRVYTAETKTAAVLEYLHGSGSLQTLCKRYGIRSTIQLRNWIKVYNAHGNFSRTTYSGGGSYMKQGRDTTKEERLEIVKDCLASGKNYGEMALKYKVSYQQVQQPRLHKTGKESTVHSRKSP